MSDSEWPKALISSLYGPGAYACWICQFISLLIAPGRRGLTLDAVAFVSYPAFATVDALVKLIQVYSSTRRSQPGDVGAEVVQLVLACRAAFHISLYAGVCISVWAGWWGVSQPWKNLVDKAVSRFHTTIFLIVPMQRHGVTAEEVVLMVCIGLVTSPTLLHQLGKITRTKLSLLLPENTLADFTLGALLGSPVFAVIAMLTLAILSMSSSGTRVAANFAEGLVGLHPLLPVFNHSITEEDQVFSLMTGILTVTWSTAARLRKHGYLPRRGNRSRLARGRSGRRHLKAS